MRFEMRHPVTKLREATRMEGQVILGNYGCDFRPGQLTERDAAMAVIAWGRNRGFVVHTEAPVRVTREGLERRCEFDVVWRSRNSDLLVIWEIDGRDAGQTHFLGGEGPKGRVGNAAKFLCHPGTLRIQVLYSVKNNLRQIQRCNRGSIRGWLGNDIYFISDEELVGSRATSEIKDEICRRIEEVAQRCA